MAVFFISFHRQSVFGGGTRLRLRGVFSDPSKSGLWRGLQRCARPVIFDMNTGDRPCKRHRQMVQPDQGLRVHQAGDDDKDVFVHISAVERAGLCTLNEGQTVEYELVTDAGKTSAENLRVCLRGRAGRPGVLFFSGRAGRCRATRGACGDALAQRQRDRCGARPRARARPACPPCRRAAPARSPAR